MDSKIDEKCNELREMFNEIEVDVLTTPLTLADAMRMGSKVTEQAFDWGTSRGEACALSAAVIAAKAFGAI
jgi:hypothetical protein